MAASVAVRTGCWHSGTRCVRGAQTREDLSTWLRRARSISANFDEFGQFRLRAISTSGNFDFGQFLDVKFLDHQGWRPRGWRP